MGKTGWEKVDGNSGKNDFFSERIFLNFIVLGFRIQSKHSTDTFARERYSPKKFYEIKVCFSHFQKLKREDDRSNSAMRI